MARRDADNLGKVEEKWEDEVGSRDEEDAADPVSDPCCADCDGIYETKLLFMTVLHVPGFIRAALR